MLVFPVEPMLASPTPVVPEPGALRGGAYYEPKFDGFRALIWVQTDGVRVQSRGGHDITICFPEVAEAMVRQVPPGVVLDAELVIWADGRLDFAALQSRLASRRKAATMATERPASLMVFDLLAVTGTPALRLPLADRRTLLEEVLKDTAPPLHLVPSTRDIVVARQWLADYASALGLGVEGIVIKAAADPYTPGKRGWLKYRLRETHEAVVGAVLGPIASPTRLILGYYTRPSGAASGRFQIAGATMQFPDRTTAKVIGSLLTPGGDEHPWPQEMPSSWLGHWGGPVHQVHRVQPTLVVEVSADTAFEYGRWRHLVRFVRARPDLDPRRVGPPT